MDLLETMEIARNGLIFEVSALVEWCNPDWDDTPEQMAEFWAKVERGDLLWFCARVRVRAFGLIGPEEYLGCCAYESLEEFTKDGACHDLMDDAEARFREAIAEAAK